MITKRQAVDLDNNMFHYVYTSEVTNKLVCKKFRRNGYTKTWVRRPNDFRLPCRHSFHDYVQITQSNTNNFYLPDECFICNKMQYIGIDADLGRPAI